MDVFLFIARYNDANVFYVSYEYYHYEWLMSSDYIIPNNIIYDIMDNDPISWGIESYKDIEYIQSNISGYDRVKKSLVVFKACVDFYSIVDVLEYSVKNNISIKKEILIDINFNINEDFDSY